MGNIFSFSQYQNDSPLFNNLFGKKPDRKPLSKIHKQTPLFIVPLVMEDASFNNPILSYNYRPPYLLQEFSPLSDEYKKT